MNIQNLFQIAPFSVGMIAVILIAHALFIQNTELYNQFYFSSYRIRKLKEYHRVFTPFLVHSGWMHAALNSLALYYFGPVVESSIGTLLTSLVFLFSVAGGSLYSMWMRRFDSDYQAVGASGGVSGLVMVSIYLQPDMGIGLFLIPVFIPAYIFGILFTLVSIVLTQSKDRNRISHEGHLGGLLIGGLVGTFLFWPLQFSEHQLLTLLGIIPMILMLFLHKRIENLRKK